MSLTSRCLALALAVFALAARAEAPAAPLKVMVLKDSPSMSYRDASGQLVGFNVDMAKLLCETIQAPCEIVETQLATVVDQIARGEADFSTVSLLATPDRVKKVAFTIPVRGSRSLLISRKNVPGGPRKVAVVEGSRQHLWAERVKEARHWSVVPVSMNAGLDAALTAGQADAVIAPFTTAVGIVQEGRLGQSGQLNVVVLDEPELSQPSAVAVTPTRPELLKRLNDAIREVQSNGKLESLNSKYFPLRML